MGAQQSMPTHAADLDEGQWAEVLKTSNVLRAWKGQEIGGKLSISRAPRQAIRWKECGPEVEISDDSYTDVQESSSSFESDMILKAFTESGIHAALAGGAHGLTFGLGGDANWRSEQMLGQSASCASTTIHGFYNFPRAIIYLEPDSLELSDVCKNFLEKHKDSIRNNHPSIDEVLEKFFRRFGGMIATRVTLGGRLCTMQEIRSEDRSLIEEKKNEMRTKLSVTIMTPAGGLGVGGGHTRGQDSSGTDISSGQTTRMAIATQGGNALLASSIPAWTDSVESYRYWRVIQQTHPEDIVSFLKAVAEDTEYHTLIDALLTRLKQKQEESEQKRLSWLIIHVDSTYSFHDDANFFNCIFHISLPEAVESISLTFQPFWPNIDQTQTYIFKNISKIITWESSLAESQSKQKGRERSDQGENKDAEMRIVIRLKYEWDWKGDKNRNPYLSNRSWDINGRNRQDIFKFNIKKRD